MVRTKYGRHPEVGTRDQGGAQEEHQGQGEEGDGEFGLKVGAQTVAR